MKYTHLNRLAAVWRLLATQTRLAPFVESEDLAVFDRRLESEGLPFLTVVLPRLGKELLRSIERGSANPVLGFESEDGGSTPLFLRRAWNAVFQDGVLRTDADGDAVACILQLSQLFYKLEVPYTRDQVQPVLDSFIAIENELRELRFTTSSLVLMRARALLCRLLAGVNPARLRPRHGSGSCATKGLITPRRYDRWRYIPRLAEVFPYDQYFYLNHNHLSDELYRLYVEDVDYTDLVCNAMPSAWDEVAKEPLARVVLVHKDSRGPRLISAEPPEFMFIQQGLWALMRDTVEQSTLMAQLVGFTDQTRQRERARLASQTKEYATLDLESASDRVSVQLVKELFPENWVKAFMACRSNATVLPDGTRVPLTKIAPMGSAVCFPVETLVFWAISVAAMRDCDLYIQTMKALSPKSGISRTRMTELVRLLPTVFGDDIIVPTQHAEKVIEALEGVGLKVNRDKSFCHGPFRESCGGDYFNGVYVAPVRVRKNITGDDEVSWARSVDLFNNIIVRYGIENVGLAAEQLLAEWFTYPTPVSSRWAVEQRIENGHRPLGAGGIFLYGRYTHVSPRIRKRFRRGDEPDNGSCLQTTEYRIRFEVAVEDELDFEGWCPLYRWFLTRDRAHDTYAPTRRVRYKWGWTTL